MHARRLTGNVLNFAVEIVRNKFKNSIGLMIFIANSCSNGNINHKELKFGGGSYLIER